MVAFCGFMIALCIFGMFLSILWLGVALFRKMLIKSPLKMMLGCFVAVFVFAIIGNILTTDEDRAAMAARESSRAIEKEESRMAKEQSESIEEQRKVDESEKQKELEKSTRESIVVSTEAETQEFSSAQEETVSESVSATVATEGPQEAATDLSFTYDKMDVKFIEHKVENDMSGTQCLVLYFDFTNNSEENKTFFTSFDVKAFQNGVSLDESFIHVNEETKNHGREIQPGTTVRVAEAFVLSESKDTIDIEIEPYISFLKKSLLEFEVNLE